MLNEPFKFELIADDGQQLFYIYAYVSLIYGFVFWLLAEIIFKDASHLIMLAFILIGWPVGVWRAHVLNKYLYKN
jgi:hypothetical protein